MFNPKHLAGASADLVWSMVKVGCKAAELERVKLQTEIQKERSEIRRKRLENRLKMASKTGGKGGLAKIPKKMKREPEPDDNDDDFLEDLVVGSDPKKPAMYSTLKTGGFVTKAEDRKGRLEKRLTLRTMTMTIAMMKRKKGNLNGKLENWKANFAKPKGQRKRQETRKNERRLHGSAKGYRVGCS